MPVTNCPDCGREVSTMAPACPHCGRPSPGATAPNAAMPATPLQEETIWRGTPSPRVLAGGLAGLLAILVGIPLIAHYLSNATSDLEQSTRILQIGWWLTGAVVLVQLIRLGMALVRIRSTIYTVTSQRIIIESGVLSKSLSEIDLRTIDDTQFFQSFTQRMLDIGDVTLVSSDKTSPVYALRNIPDARAMRETIRTNAYRVSQRQLFTRQA